MLEIKECPVCWGEKYICNGLTEDFQPILNPCPGCDCSGWIHYKTIDRIEKLVNPKLKDIRRWMV